MKPMRWLRPDAPGDANASLCGPSAIESKLEQYDDAAKLLRDMHTDLRNIPNAATADVLKGLERVRELRVMAHWQPLRGQDYASLYEIVSRLCNRQQLTAEEAGQLAPILSWPELRAHPSRGATPYCIVWAVRRCPSRRCVPILESHLVWLEEKMASFSHPRDRDELLSETDATKEAILACREQQTPR